MADQQFNPDMFTQATQLTNVYHRDVYDAVDSKNPGLSAKGRVVLVTGAGGGLGYAIASAWSTAGAEGIVLVGRNAEKLEATAATLKVPSLVAAGDIISESDVASVFEQAKAKFGKVNVVINTAGTGNIGSMIGEIEPSKWFQDYESNIRGLYNLAHYFIKATGGKGTLINLVSTAAAMLVPGLSSYGPAKLAAIKLAEHIALEQPDLRVFSIHPGIVEAEEGRGQVIDNFTPFAKDKQALTGGLTLYLQKPEADFLSGGFLTSNWDVKELEAHKEEIVDKKLTQLAFLNAPLGQGGYSWSK